VIRVTWVTLLTRVTRMTWVTRVTPVTCMTKMLEKKCFPLLVNDNEQGQSGGPSRKLIKF